MKARKEGHESSDAQEHHSQLSQAVQAALGVADPHHRRIRSRAISCVRRRSVGRMITIHHAPSLPDSALLPIAGGSPGILFSGHDRGHRPAGQ
jgi:hypothetical protein